jgi:hypothetical protein
MTFSIAPAPMPGAPHLDPEMGEVNFPPIRHLQLSLLVLLFILTQSVKGTDLSVP